MRRVYGFDSEKDIRRVMTATRRAEQRPAMQPARRTRSWPRGAGGSCAAQNEKHQLHIFGSPTGGTFDVIYIIDQVQNTLTIAYNAPASTVKTALESHDSVSSGDVDVIGGPFPDSTIEIEFKDDLASTRVQLPRFDWSSLTGGSGVAALSSRVQSAH